jgi:hypothetical protein
MSGKVQQRFVVNRARNARRPSLTYGAYRRDYHIVVLGAGMLYEVDLKTKLTTATRWCGEELLNR